MGKNAKNIAVCALIVMASGLWIISNGRAVAMENEPFELWVHAPSTVQKQIPFEFHVQAWDVYERLSSKYTGEVSFELISFRKSGANFYSYAILPEDYNFTGDLIEQSLIPGYKLASIDGKDHGRHTFSATIMKAGIHYIKVKDNLGNIALSNPIEVSEDEPSKFLYWGDIHGHSALCDGSGYLEDCYRFAKEVAYLDFASVTTHDDWTDYYGSAPDFGHLWEISKAAANRWNSPGDFTTIMSFEWTSQLLEYGHMNVYYKGDDGPMFSSSYPQYISQDKLWIALREWKKTSGSDVITIPHHSGHVTSGMYFDWSYYDPEFVPLVEIYSAHGSSEKMNGLKTIKPGESKTQGYHVQNALAMGYKVGLMASSDTHDGRIGHPILHTEANNRLQYPYTSMGLAGGFRFGEEYEGCLTGVWVENLTRDDIFDALKQRACYGSTHVKRPIVTFSINGVSVGEDDSTAYVNAPNSDRNIDVFVAIDASQESNLISNITLIKNNVDIDWINPDSLLYNYHYTDSAAITGMNYTYGVDTANGYKIAPKAKITLSNYSVNKPPSTNWDGSGYSDLTDVYYVRITQNNGEMAWIGPIWVKVQ